MSDTEHGISTQAYICPVCFDDHSTGPHRFTDEELAARDTAAHRVGYQTALDDVRSGAFISGSSYEAMRDSQTGRQIRAELRAEIAADIRAAKVRGSTTIRLLTYEHAATIAEGTP